MKNKDTDMDIYKYKNLIHGNKTKLILNLRGEIKTCYIPINNNVTQHQKQKSLKLEIGKVRPLDQPPQLVLFA